MGRTDSTSRLVAASVTRAFDALVDPSALLRWLPPAGMTAHFEHFNAQPGGSYRLVLTYAHPPEAGGKTAPDADVVDGRFVEIVAGARVVQAVDFVSADPSFAGTMTMTWSVAEAAGGTLVEMRADDVPPGISAEDHLSGMNASLDGLVAYLAG